MRAASTGTGLSTAMLFRQALRGAYDGTVIAAIVTAAVIAPAFTVAGFIITVYPLYLIMIYPLHGWRGAAHLGKQVTMPRWREALIIGGGVALALTLGILITALSLTAIVGATSALLLKTANASAAPGSGNGVFRMMYTGLVGIAICTAIGGITIGYLLAWLGAWLRLRQRPIPPGTPKPPDAPQAI